MLLYSITVYEIYVSMAQFTPTYSLQRHNLPRTGGKLCHDTTFFLKAIFLKQFISDLKLLLPGMQHILKYTYIFHLATLLSWPHFHSHEPKHNSRTLLRGQGKIMGTQPPSSLKEDGDTVRNEGSKIATDPTHVLNME